MSRPAGWARKPAAGFTITGVSTRSQRGSRIPPPLRVEVATAYRHRNFRERSEQKFRGGVGLEVLTPPRTNSLRSFVRPSLKGRVDRVSFPPVLEVIDRLRRAPFGRTFGA